MAKNKTNEEINMDEIDEGKLTIEDVLAIATGVDEEGIPRTFCEFRIDDVSSEDKVKTIADIITEKGSYRYFINGGCAVLQIDFSKEGKFEYIKLTKICQQWMDMLNNGEDAGKLFTGIAVPNLLLGQITMVFQELVYYLGVEGEDFFRIILCFDNNKSDMLETSDIDYSEIRKLVIEEMTEEQRLLDQEFDKAQYELEEAEKAEREAYYENNIKPLYDRQNEEVDENNNEEQKESLFKRRFSDDE